MLFGRKKYSYQKFDQTTALLESGQNCFLLEASGRFRTQGEIWLNEVAIVNV